MQNIEEKLRRLPCPYPNRDCDICPHKDKQLREEGIQEKKGLR